MLSKWSSTDTDTWNNQCSTRHTLQQARTICELEIDEHVSKRRLLVAIESHQMNRNRARVISQNSQVLQ